MIRQFERKDNLYIIRFQGGTFKQDVTLMHSLEGARFVSADKYWVATASEWNKSTLIKHGFKDLLLEYSGSFYSTKIKKCYR